MVEDPLAIGGGIGGNRAATPPRMARHPNRADRRCALSVASHTRTLDPMSSRLGHRLVRLRPGDLVQALAIVAVAARIECSLRRRGLPETASRFGLRLDGPTSETSECEHGGIPRWAIRRARLAEILMRRWPFGDTCLRKSLVIGNRIAALSPQLLIGVRAAEDDGSIAAHAWLRVCGIDIDPASAEFVAFDFS